MIVPIVIGVSLLAGYLGIRYLADKAGEAVGRSVGAQMFAFPSTGTQGFRVVRDYALPFGQFKSTRGITTENFDSLIGNIVEIALIETVNGPGNIGDIGTPKPVLFGGVRRGVNGAILGTILYEDAGTTHTRPQDSKNAYVRLPFMPPTGTEVAVFPVDIRTIEANDPSIDIN